MFLNLLKKIKYFCNKRCLLLPAAATKDNFVNTQTLNASTVLSPWLMQDHRFTVEVFDRGALVKHKQIEVAEATDTETVAAYIQKRAETALAEVTVAVIAKGMA